MPVRINLKEVFPGDPEEITLDKINYNFNQLLELGVGKKGMIGLTGPEGSIGPIGLTGDQGQRGNKWFTGVGNPNGQSFTDLIDNDYFLDADTSSVWQYDEGTDTWTQVTDLSLVVNEFLAEAGQTFKRGFGEGSPQDQRFITFLNRDDTVNDSSLGNASDNDVFFLHNFEELDLVIENFASTTNDYFNAIQSIYALQTISPVGRYHLEFGALYQDATSSPAVDKMTTVAENLKMRFLKQQISSPEFTLSNPFVTISRFSMSVPETGGTRLGNGIFEFVTPKYNIDSNPYIGDVTVKMGAKEGLSEFASVNTLADGIQIFRGTEAVEFGIAYDLEEEFTLPYSAGEANMAIINIDETLDGLFINGNGHDTIHTGGNFRKLVTSSPVQLDKLTVFTAGTDAHYMSQNVRVFGQRAWIATSRGDTFSDSVAGGLRSIDLSNPDEPVLGTSQLGDKSIPAVPSPLLADEHGHGFTGVTGLGLIKDVAEYGKYVVYISPTATGGTPLPGQLYIAETDANVMSMITFGRVEDSILDYAYRVEVTGKYAFVISNNTANTGIQLETGSYNEATIASIDISDANNPTKESDFTDEKGSKYLDFKIKDDYAFVLKYTNYYDDTDPGGGAHTHRASMVWFDISSAVDFGTQQRELFPGSVFTDHNPFLELDLETFTVNTVGPDEFGAIDHNGRFIIAIFNDLMHIVDWNQSTGFSASLESSTSLASETVEANDIILSGRYAYVLVNYSDSTGGLQVWDVKDAANPIKVSELRNSDLFQASRLDISGKHIYAIQQDGITTSIITIDIDGIEASSILSGHIRTQDIQVLNNMHIQNNLHVKTSLNVGPGGIFVDEGAGIVTDGPIIQRFQSDYADTGIKIIHNSNDTFDNSVVAYTALMQGEGAGPSDLIEFDNTYYGFYSFNQYVKYDTQAFGNYVRFDNVTHDGTNTHAFFGLYTNSTGSATKWGIRLLGEDKNHFDGIILASGGISLPNEPTSAGTGNRVALRFDAGAGDNVGRIVFSSSTLASIVSDRSLKKNIIPLENISENFEKLNPVSFEYKDEEFDKGIKMGFIAQEVQELFPDVVFDLDGLLNMDKFSFTALNTKMIQTLNDKIKEKDIKIKQLEDRLAAIEKKLGL